MTAKKSKWFWWSFLPFFNFAAWIHAAIRTGRNSYYWSALVYGVPFTVALGVGMVEKDLGLSKETVERVTDVASTAATVLWIAGMIHVLLKKDSVDQQIQAYDDSRMQGGRFVASSTPLPSDQGSASRREDATASGSPELANPQLGTLQNRSLSSTANTAVPIPHAGKTFKYIDAQGNLIGPATLAALGTLKRAGIVCDTTQVIDEATKRSMPLQQLFAVGPDAPQPRLQDTAPSANRALSVPPPR